MAEQEGISSYSGKLGDKVGYRRGKKYFERKRIQPYQPPEESMKSASEFGKASKASALFRKAFGNLFLRSFLPNLHSRLTKAFGSIIRSGPVSEKGKREVIDGNISLLKGFELNSYKKFEDLSPVGVHVEIKDGLLTAKLSSLELRASNIPGDRYKICFGFVWFDFIHGSYSAINANPLYINVGDSIEEKCVRIEIPEQGKFTFVMLATVCMESGGTLQRKTISENRRYQAGGVLEAINFEDSKAVTFDTDSPAPVLKDAKREPVFDISWE